MGQTLSVGGALTADSAALNDTLSVLGAAELNSTVHVVGAASFDSTITGDGLQCSKDATAKIELCSQSDGSDRGPSIDATTGGATKFHVGGVLKVKVSDQGVAIFGATSFSGNATFDGPATFNDEATFNSGTSFNGGMNVNSGASFNSGMSVETMTVYGTHTLDGVFNVTDGADLMVQSGGTIEVKSGGYLKLHYGNDTTTAGTLTGSVQSSTVSFDALSGKITSSVLLDVTTRHTEEITFSNGEVSPESLIYVSVEPCTSTGNAQQVLQVSARPGDGTATIIVHNPAAVAAGGCNTSSVVHFAILDGFESTGSRRR
jgi:hypothetical protein